MLVRWRGALTPVVLGIAGAVLLAWGMAATNTAPRAHAITNCSVADFSLDSEELAFLTLINNYRQANGLNTLKISTNLNRAAHWMAWDLGTTPNWGHTDSLGRSPHQRALDCGYPQGAGENLAAGTTWSTAQKAFDAWKGSSGHNANMLNQNYRQIGIARVYVAGSPYGWYWVTNFGATDDGTGGGASPTNTPAPTNTPVPTSMPTNTPVTSQPFVPPTATPTKVPPTATPTKVPPTATPTKPPPTATPTKPAATPTPTPTPTGSYNLQSGVNLVGWNGQTSSPQQALKHVENEVSIVYSWDRNGRRWLRYSPGLPSYANTLSQLRSGEAYWVVLK